MDSPNIYSNKYPYVQWNNPEFHTFTFFNNMRLTDKTPLAPYKPQSVLLLREKVHKEWILFLLDVFAHVTVLNALLLA